MEGWKYNVALAHSYHGGRGVGVGVVSHGASLVKFRQVVLGGLTEAFTISPSIA